MRLGYQYDFMLNICLAAKKTRALNVCQSTSELCKSARAIQCILLSAVSKPLSFLVFKGWYCCRKDVPSSLSVADIKW